MQTSTHRVTIGDTEVRKEFIADHEIQAEREWACLTLLAEHAPGLAPTWANASTPRWWGRRWRERASTWLRRRWL